MSWQCTRCKKNLFRHPKILVYTKIYCFHCAKWVVKHIAQKWLDEFEAKVGEYNLLKRQHEQEKSRYDKNVEEWHKETIERLESIPAKREEYVKKGSLLMVIFACFGFVPFTFLISMPNVWVIPVLLGVTLMCLEIETRSKRKEEFERRVDVLLPVPPHPTNLVAPFDVPEPVNNIRERLKSLHRPAPPLDGSAFYDEPYRPQILFRDNYTCQKCGKQNTRFEVHHVIPKDYFGTDHPTNLILLCYECHCLETWYGHHHKAATNAIQELGSYGMVYDDDAENENKFKYQCRRDNNGNIILDEYLFGLIFQIFDSFETLNKQTQSIFKSLDAVYLELGELDKRINNLPQ